MRKIKPKSEDHSKDSGPDLYEKYFEKHNIGPEYHDTSCEYKYDIMKKVLVKGTNYKDDIIGELISNQDRLDILVEDRIIENNRKKY